MNKVYSKSLNSKVIIGIGIGIAIVIAIGIVSGVSMSGNDMSSPIDIESNIEQSDGGKEYVLEFSDVVNPSTGP